MKSALSIILGLLITHSVIGQVIEKDGIYMDASNHVYSGLHKEFNAEGTLVREMEIKNGQLDGQVVFYSLSGKVEEKGHYAEGKKSGVWHQFNDAGSKIGEAFYKEGQKDGIWTIWDDQGVKRYHMVYSMGKKIDVWKMWDERAVLVSERTYND
jgi:antitoxin component YwqK of YwqJK toxin-antitoxin module